MCNHSRLVRTKSPRSKNADIEVTAGRKHHSPNQSTNRQFSDSQFGVHTLLANRAGRIDCVNIFLG